MASWPGAAVSGVADAGRAGTRHLTIHGHDSAHIGSASDGSGTVNAFSRNETSV